MSIRFKNAGLKNTEEDIKEALKRMIDGEVFYLEEKLIQFQIKQLMDARYCFMVNNMIRLDSSELIRIAEWKVKADWRENIGKGVWCWVWDNSVTEDKRPELVTEYDNSSEYEYRDAYGTVWRYARPMTREEVENYIWGD